MATKLDRRIIEAILFAVGKYISEDDIARLMNLENSKNVKKILKEIQKDYDDRGSPMMVISEQDKWKLTVREEFMPVVQRIIPSTELNKSVMETLAVIAWKAPLKQSDLIDIRSNKAYDHINELVDKDFITKERHGRTYMLKLTRKFYEYFDVQGKEDLRHMFKDFEDDEELQKELDDFEKNKKPDHMGNLEVYDSQEGPGEEIEEKKADVVPIKKGSSGKLEEAEDSEEDDNEEAEKNESEETKVDNEESGEDEEKTDDEEEKKREDTSEDEGEIEKVVKKKHEIDEEMPGLDDVFDEDNAEDIEEKKKDESEPEEDKEEGQELSIDEESDESDDETDEKEDKENNSEQETETEDKEDDKEK